MKPRHLRHRLEKAAKLLVIVQKRTPEVSCIIDQDKGSDGRLVVDFSGSGESRSKMKALGKDFESRGYTFTQKKNYWLGQTTYTGRANEKPTVVITLPIEQDRLAINEEAPEKAYSFKGS